MKIKTHKMNQKYSGSYFFILSKGNNAGKPLEEPCANCFVFLASDEKERQHYYWLCFGLWQGGFFRAFLSGSVIPFIRLHELKQVINEAELKAELKVNEFLNAIEMLTKLTRHQESITKQLQLIKQAKKALMYKILK